MLPNWPKTLDEAVARLMASMRVEDLAALRDTPEGGLIMYHFSLGMFIRNEFGLWQGNEELLASCFPDVTDPYMLMTIEHDPDKASGVIAKEMWERLE
jgi:hypothetical protein